MARIDPYSDPGIHNPFDRIVRSLSDESPPVLMHMIGIAPMDGTVTVSPMRPETAPTVVFPDYAAVLSVESADPFTFHAEFQLVFSEDIPSRMARCGGSLAWQYQRRVVSALLLLWKKGAPRHVQSVGVHAIGNTVTTHPYKVVRAWTLDPAPILATGNPRLYPWAALMKTTKKQMRWIGRALKETGDEELMARFLLLGTLRYSREELEKMLGGLRMSFVEVIKEGSSIVREWREQSRAEGLEKGREEGLEKGLQKGLEKGLEKGREEEARRMLRGLLQTKFPGLEATPAIDQITDVRTLEALFFEQVLRSEDREAVLRAILTAAADSPEA